MNPCTRPEHHTRRRVLFTASITALAITVTVALPQPARADHGTRQRVPGHIQVPAGNKAFLEGHAVGTQGYVCLPAGDVGRKALVPYAADYVFFKDRDHDGNDEDDR